MCLFDDTCGIGHGSGFAAVYLDSHGALLGAYVELAHSGGYVADERVGVDELGIDAVGTEALAEQAEGGVGDVLHGSKKELIYHLVIYHVPFYLPFGHLPFTI